MYYGGLDVHTQYVTVVLMNGRGDVVCETSVPSQATAQLLETLAPFRPLEVAVEACGLWPWLHDLLAAAGIAVVLAHATAVRRLSASPHKNDGRDGRLLAHLLQSRLLPRVYAKTPAQRERARLIRHRVTLVRLRTRLANRLHAQLHQANLPLPREQLLRAATRTWVHETAWPQLTPEQRAMFTTHLMLIDAVATALPPLDQRVHTLARTDPTAQLLQTIPGIGPFWAVLLTAEIFPITRFARAAHLVSYAGLAPRTRSSGGHTRHGALPTAANRWVRWALVSAIPAHVAAAPDSALSQTYATLKARIGWRAARIATARKLARGVYRMLQTEHPWSNNADVARPPTKSCRSTTSNFRD